MQSQLQAIEKQYQVKILHACEAGSRAWDFPSPDSDYDVRFIYKHDIDYYLTLQKQNDVINPKIDGVYDIGDWDIQKALGLLWKSNVPLLEWIHSPIIYLEIDSIIQRLKEVAYQCYSPAAAFYHYHSMAKKYLDLCKGDKYKLKHLFYALRTTLAAQWTTESRNFPPVNFNQMIIGLAIPLSIQEEIEKLRVFKFNQEEGYCHPASKELQIYLAATVQKNENNSQRAQPAKGQISTLNYLFKEIVLQY